VQIPPMAFRPKRSRPRPRATIRAAAYPAGDRQFAPRPAAGLFRGTDDTMNNIMMAAAGVAVCSQPAAGRCRIVRAQSSAATGQIAGIAFMILRARRRL